MISLKINKNVIGGFSRALVIKQFLFYMIMLLKTDKLKSEHFVSFFLPTQRSICKWAAVLQCVTV